MSKRVLHLVLLFLIVLANSILTSVYAQKAGVINGAQAQRNDVERASLNRYRELAELPVPERREAFIQASAMEKSSLWRIHLALSLASRPELSSEQRDVILEAISLATPELFGISSESPQWKAQVDEPLKSLMQRALKAYPKKEAAAIFAHIGDDKAELTLLQKHRDISSRSVAERKEFFEKLNSEEKSDLWRFHLALYLAHHPNLKREQRKVILDAMSLATPELFSLSPDNPLWKTQVEKPLQSLNQRALTVFSKSEGAEIFNALGGQESLSVRFRPRPGPKSEM